MKVSTKFKLLLLSTLIAFITMLLAMASFGVLAFDPSWGGSIVCFFEICLAIIFLPIVITLAVFLLLAFKKMRSYESIITHFKFKGRDNIGEAAVKLGMDQEKLISTLLKIKAEDLMEGYFDKASGDFVWIENTRVSLFDQPMKCSQCGATNTKKLLMGDTPVCEYCGSGLVAKDAARVCPFGHSLVKDERGEWMCNTCGRPY